MRLLRPVATMLAMCTNGPSFPSGIPAPSTHISPIAFATSVLPERKSLSTTPRKIVLSSGRPEPAAVGATRAIRPALKHTSMVGSVDHARYESIILSPSSWYRWNREWLSESMT